MLLVFLLLYSLVCVNTTSCLQCKEQSLVHSCDFTASIHMLYVAIQRSAVSREHFDGVFLCVNLLLYICLQKMSYSIKYISLYSFMTALCSRQAEMRFKNVVLCFVTTWNRPLHAQSPGSTTRFSNCCVHMLEVLKPIHRSYSSAIGVVAFKTKCTQRQTRPARNLVLARYGCSEPLWHCIGY